MFVYNRAILCRGNEKEEVVVDAADSEFLMVEMEQ